LLLIRPKILAISGFQPRIIFLRNTPLFFVFLFSFAFYTASVSFFPFLQQPLRSFHPISRRTDEVARDTAMGDSQYSFSLTTFRFVLSLLVGLFPFSFFLDFGSPSPC
jgi:hypothetical protein